MDTLRESEGKDGIVIYIENPKAKKELPPNQNVEADESLVNRLQERFGKGKCHGNGFLIGKKQFSRYNVKNISKKSLKIARQRVKIEEIV